MIELPEESVATEAGVAIVIPSLSKAPHFLENPCGRHEKQSSFLLRPRSITKGFD